MKKPFLFSMILIIALAALLTACVSGDEIIEPLPLPPLKQPKTPIETSIQEAVDNAKDGDKIYLRDGNYDEEIALDKNVSIEGEGKARIKSVKGAPGIAVKVKGVMFYAEKYPEEGKASLYVGEGGSLEVVGCDFLIDIKNQAEEFAQEGGFGIFAEKLTKKIEILGCTFSNYNYAVYIDRTGAEFNIYNNVVTHCKNSLALDIRDPDEAHPQNLPASGKVASAYYIHNKYNSCFYYAGDKWPEKLIIEDWSLKEGGKEVPTDNPSTKKN